MKLAKVTAVHPEKHKVDLLFLDDGRRVPGVKVMTGMASSSSGMAGLATPDAQDSPDPYDAPAKSGRDLIACVGFYQDVPVVIGFLFPEVSECLFADLDRYLHRTASDVYWTVDGKGNAELFHPCGAYIRLATNPAHEDLKGKDFHQRFNPKRNADRQVHIHIQQAGGAASIDISPSGAIEIKSVSTTRVTSDGGVKVQAPSVEVDSPDSHFTGKLTVDGLLTFNGGMAGSGGAGGKAATLSGTLEVTGGDVTADGKSFKGHTHPGDSGGTTGPPT